jgi:hypothetical protein
VQSLDPRLGPPPACWRLPLVSPHPGPPTRFPVRDANGQALAYVYCRANEAEAMQAKVLTEDEARRVAVNVARLPDL